MSPSTSAILRYISENILENSENMDEPKEKKRRLNHLTWEEKVQRKKLKNRVAAQTSRDRKKARMEQLEAVVQELYTQNERLEADCDRLRAENAELRDSSATRCQCQATNNRNPRLTTPKSEPLDIDVASSPTNTNITENDTNITEIHTNTTEMEQSACAGPAVSRITNPLQQGALFLPPVVPTTVTLPTVTMVILVLVFSLTSLYPNCSSWDWASAWTNQSRVSNRWISSQSLCSGIWWRSWQHRTSQMIPPMSLILDLSSRPPWWGRHQSNWNPLLPSLAIMSS